MEWHLLSGIVSAALILILWLIRRRIYATKSEPSAAYFIGTLLALTMIGFTGHLGGILSGVETP